MEVALARVCREAGAVVRTHTLLKDLNVDVRAGDNRRLEVVAQGLPLKGGAQLVVDVTLRSVLGCDGKPKPRSADEDGAVATDARKDKENAYPELVSSNRCALVVVALETGGRWSTEAVKFVEELSFAKARSAQPRVRFAATLAWRRRWSRLLSVAAGKAFASSLVSPTGKVQQTSDGVEPELSEVLSRE